MQYSNDQNNDAQSPSDGKSAADDIFDEMGSDPVIPPPEEAFNKAASIRILRALKQPVQIVRKFLGLDKNG